VAVVPLDRDAAPCNSDNGAEISNDLFPTHAVSDFELSGLFAGHLIHPYIDRIRGAVVGAAMKVALVVRRLGRLHRAKQLGIAQRYFTQLTTLKINEYQTLSDLIHPLFDRVKSCMHCPVVKIKYVSKSYKTKNPVVSFDVAYCGLDSVTN
jgi:hypothetical protein